MCIKTDTVYQSDTEGGWSDLWSISLWDRRADFDASDREMKLDISMGYKCI